MTLFFKSVRDIAEWMDSKDYPLIQCYKEEIKSYSRTQFIADLRELPQHISNERLTTGQYGWDKISIARCLKGLKGLPAIREVQQILNALALQIENSQAQLDAQAIGNALYGLQNMDIKIEVVAALMRVLNNKCDSFSYQQAPLAWKQTVSGYLTIAIKQEPSAQVMVLKYLSNFLPKEIQLLKTPLTIETIQDTLLQKLKEYHFKEGYLDLHGLDHLSAALLLQEGFKNSDNLKSIVFGASSHSKAAVRDKMKKCVTQYINTYHLSGTWTRGSFHITSTQNPDQKERNNASKRKLQFFALDSDTNIKSEWNAEVKRLQ